MMRAFAARAIACALVAGAVSGYAYTSRASTAAVGHDATVTGTVTYRERVTLPPDAVAEVSLIDATVRDASAKVVAKTSVKSDGKQVPLAFALHYDAGKIDKKHLYTVRAEIRSGDQLLWTTDIARAVITQGNPTDVEIVLSRVDPDAGHGAGVTGGAGGSTSVGELAGSAWVLEDLNDERAIADVRATLDFGAAGKATGSGSCNRFTASVDISGETIRFGAVSATRMACATAVSLQEIRYFEALEDANRFEIQGNELSIYGSARRPLRFSRAAP